MVVWVIFSGFFDFFHLSLGVISCGIVTWLSASLLFDDRSIPARRRIVQGARFASYMVWLTWQIVLSNIAVLKLAFAPRSALQPQIVRYRTPLKTDFGKFLLANSITLTPGTTTLDIDPIRRELLLHMLDGTDPRTAVAGIRRHFEAPLLRLFPEHDHA